MKAETAQGGLQRYLDIERRLLAHRAKRWFEGRADEDEEAEARFFDELESAGRALTPEECTALRGLVVARAPIRPGDEVDVASPRRTGLRLRSRATRPRGPLVVWVQYRPEGIELSLPSATRARLGASIALRMKAVLPAEVVSHFPGQGPEALLEVAAALTGRDRERLRRAGGLVFFDPATEAEVFRWPEKAPTSKRSSARSS